MIPGRMRLQIWAAALSLSALAGMLRAEDKPNLAMENVEDLTQKMAAIRMDRAKQKVRWYPLEIKEEIQAWNDLLKKGAEPKAIWSGLGYVEKCTGTNKEVWGENAFSLQIAYPDEAGAAFYRKFAEKLPFKFVGGRFILPLGDAVLKLIAGNTVLNRGKLAKITYSVVLESLPENPHQTIVLPAATLLSFVPIEDAEVPDAFKELHLATSSLTGVLCRYHGEEFQIIYDTVPSRQPGLVVAGAAKAVGSLDALRLSVREFEVYFRAGKVGIVSQKMAPANAELLKIARKWERLR